MSLLTPAFRPRLWTSLALTIALLACARSPASIAPPHADASIPTAAPSPPSGATPPEAGPDAAAGTALPDAEPVNAPVVGLERIGREAWYGLYFMGRKVGHAHLWDRRTQGGEPGAYAMGFAMRMSVGAAGPKNELVAEELRFYGEDAPYPLVETRFLSTAAGFKDERSAHPVDVTGPDGKPARAMRITRNIDGKAQPVRDVAASDDNLVGQFAVMPLALDKARLGGTAKAALWSWEREADEVVSVTFRALTRRLRAGIEEEVGSLDLVYTQTGVKATTQLTADGTLLEMVFGPSLTLKLEERSVAEGGVVGLDIMGTGLPSPTKLGPPSEVTSLELVFEGPPGRIPTSANQRVEMGPQTEGASTTHTVRITRAPGDPVTDAERAEALAEDATFDLSHPTLQAQARAILEPLALDADDEAKSQAISRWVYQNLDKRLATHLPTASTILARRVGDCTEHTWLAIALLRAAKLPARPAYGIAYTGDAEALFAYHAWVEVALDGRWVAIDPTWGEGRADATHVRLGTSLGEVSASLGGLRLLSAKRLEAP